MAAYNGWMGDYHVPDMAKPMATLSEAVSQYSDKRDDKAIGAAAATGKLSDAANEAFRRGKLKQGATLADLDDDRKAEVTKLLSRGAQFADTPEKWASFQQTLQKRFPGEDIDSFEQRDSYLSLGRDPYKERELDQRDKALRISEAKGSGTGKGGRPHINVEDKKRVYAAEDSLVQYNSTIENLRAAKEVSEKAFDGAGAGAKAAIGAKIPGGSYLVDEAGAKATLEYEKLMTPEALSLMAQTLKGATTDQEMNRYIDLISDPTTPKDIRNRTIDRLILLAERQAEIATTRINEIRGNTYWDQGGGSSDDPEAKPDPKEDPLGLR
jgi:hypothetical protein